MTEQKEKKKPVVPVRETKKKTSGIFDNLRPLPANPVEEILGLAPAEAPRTDPSQPVPTQPIPTHPNPSQHGKVEPAVAPARDFNRRANSVDRDALPAGLFPGTSKKLYDALYLKTRGAVTPTRTIQATKRELMIWSGIKSKNTIAVNLQILLSSGLLHRTLEIGDHGGSVYEVFLPEELNLLPTHPNPSQPIPTHPGPTQKLGGDPTQKLGWVGMGNLIENKGTSGGPKTSFKTNTESTDDDEAFAALVALLKQAAKKLTGKDPTPADRDRWKEVAELLVTELEVAASRTTVSSAPAFLAEHLRRRLRKADASQIEREVREAAAGAKSAAPPKPELTPEQLQEQVNLLAGLVRDGATMKELEEQFAADFRPAQWHMIRSMTLAQAKVQARPGAGD